MKRQQRISESDFFEWLEFFRGMIVVIGNGSTQWRLSGGYFETDRNRGRVVLKRRNGHGEIVRTTCDAERIRRHATN